MNGQINKRLKKKKEWKKDLYCDTDGKDFVRNFVLSVTK